MALYMKKSFQWVTISWVIAQLERVPFSLPGVKIIKLTVASPVGIASNFSDNQSDVHFAKIKCKGL